MAWLTATEPQESRLRIRDQKIVILGAGPTGLGAAHRLAELGYSNFLLLEKEKHAGGLASSFTDNKGFTWDIGGHVQFSHYPYFDQLMNSLLAGEWLHHQRESWIWMRERFIPYPFQNNIRYLPKEQMLECLNGLFDVYRNSSGAPANFEQWLVQNFGDGVARHFMFPYNFKVWAYSPAELNYHWIGERVATPDLKRIVNNIINGTDDQIWGPNNSFRFPLCGGTGEIWRRLAATLPKDKLRLGETVRFIDTKRRIVTLEDGSQEDYGVLISTIPLDQLVDQSDLEELKPVAHALRHSATNVVGLGLRGSPPPHLRTKCWMYFPELDIPFYRATVFSNYSPRNVPLDSEYWSLMLEVSESSNKPVEATTLLDSAVSGARGAMLIDDISGIVDTWIYRASYGYPTPTLSRDAILRQVLPALEQREVFSRGRFGGWKYEVSNQDHSLMQGVEVVDRLLTGEPERTWPHPALVNAPRA